MTESDAAKDVLRREQETALLKLLPAYADLQDTMSLIIEGMPETDVPEGDKAAFIYASESIISFIDSDPKLLTVRPRSIREKDRNSILPGQHAGVFAQFGLEDGTILKVNFWGGLRTVSSMDVKENDLTLRRTHTARTDAIASQLTHLNFQIIYPGDSSIDSWISYNPQNGEQFCQSKLIVDGEPINDYPRISGSDPRFTQLKNEVFNPIKELVNLVPSSV